MLILLMMFGMRERDARGFIFKTSEFYYLFRYEVFIRFETWKFVSNCVREYVDVVVFVSALTNSLAPRTVLRA